MYDNFTLCLQAVLPVFIYMAIGMGIRKVNLLNDREVRKFNHLIFVIFFPVLMFHNLYGHHLEEIVNGHLAVFGISIVLGIYFLSIPIILKIEKSQASRGAMIQAIYRSNFIIMGLPVAMSIVGDQKAPVTMMMVAIIVPLYNIMAVITLEIFRGGRPKLSRILLRILMNPLILSAIAGIIAAITALHLPAALEGIIDDMAGITSPLAVMILGASFDFQAVAAKKRDVAICVFGRLVAVPAIGLSLAALLGFRNVEFITLLAMLAAPTAVSSFTMAESMGSDGKLAGACVVFSSAFSVFTMFLWLFLFKNLGMF